MTPQTTPSNEASTYVFSPRELQRLVVYRAAIAAGFYTDDYERPTPRTSRQPTIGRAATLRRSAAHSPVA